MKNKLWIFLCIIGGILMIIGSAAGSAVFYQFLYWNLAVPYVDPDFLPFIQAILTILEYIAFYGGYSVLVGTFLILINQIRAGKIVITIATSFGMLGLIIYTLTWAISYFSISLNPSLLLILTQIATLFTFNSGIAFTGTVIAVLGRFFVGKFEKAEKESSTSKEKSKSNSGSKYCPKCGASLPKKANFCNKCGKNF
jgi:ribosomal protein L40E